MPCCGIPPLPSNCPRSQPTCDMSWAASPKAPECWQRSSHRRRYKARRRQLADWFVKTPLRQGREANRIRLPRRLPNEHPKIGI
jgi:hypothetical protein